MKKAVSLIVVCLLVYSMFVPIVMAAGDEEPIIFKIALTDAPFTKIGEYELPHPSYAAMLAFKNSLEKSSAGRIKVELYPGGSLGDAKSNLEQILSGNLQGATPADGAVAPFYKNIQAFAIPYLFENALQAYEILDSPVAQEIFDDMAEKSGLRVLAAYDNGGFRNFSNNKKVVKSAEDMQGLKIRTMDISAHMEMVKALGASPIPIAWMELYSALQTGVVDGQENSAITVLSGSLQEVQKYYTLDGHLMSIAYLVTGEEFLRSLPEDLQEAVLRAGKEAAIAARGAVRAAESLALSALEKAGMKIYAPTPEEMETFKVAQEPVIKYLKENINADYVDKVLALANNKEGAAPSQIKEDIGEKDNKEVKKSESKSSAQTNNGTSNIMYILIGVFAVIIIAFIIVKNKKTINN